MRRSSSVQVDSSADVILQAFNWEVSEYGGGWFKALAAKAAHIKGSGFAAVWLPPPSVSVSKEVQPVSKPPDVLAAAQVCSQQARHTLHMQGYLPRELEVLDSKYGTEAELRGCIAALKASDVVAIADIVINHRCAGKQVHSCHTAPLWAMG